MAIFLATPFHLISVMHGSSILRNNLSEVCAIAQELHRLAVDSGSFQIGCNTFSCLGCAVQTGKDRHMPR